MKPSILFALTCSLIVVLAGHGAEGAPGEEVMLTINHSKFVPGELNFRAGQTVTFVIVNADPIDHEFILGAEDVQHRHKFGTEPHHDEIPTEVSIPAKKRVTTTVSFDEPGTLIIGCHLPGHYAYGMKASVTLRL